MEGSSVLLCKGSTPWQGLLLTASFLTFWHLSTTAHVTTELMPSQVAEGENVLFLVHDLPENLTVFAWFKGLRSMKHGIAMYLLRHNLSGPGPVYSSRETIYRNGSLLLEKVTQKDTGFYTLRTYNRRAKIISTTSIYLHVHAFLWNCGRFATPGQPTIESVPPTIAEGGSVLLLVRNPPENIIAFAWFKGMTVIKTQEIARYITDKKSPVTGSAYSGRETMYQDGSLLLHGVTQKDPGLYTLRILRTDMTSEMAHVQLQLDTSLSLCCNPLTSSQLMIQPVPQYVAKGENVLLQVHNLPEDLQAFSWYKSIYRGQVLKIVEYSNIIHFISWEPEYRNRGTVYNNGSLLLENVTKKDAGMYALAVLNKDFKIEEAYVKFYVNKYVTRPLVRITDTTVAGRRSVVFTCASPDTDISIRWIFNNKTLQLTERTVLSPTKCGLKIDPVKRGDAGEYKCEVSNQFSMKTSLPVSLAMMNE
ncbi:pregnancy-specific glycoprotein 22 [Phodopus roborovskii]|uniref:Unknown_gene_12259 protein n=1 Tax=Phodopus roborovskii TaxID=109678 RepID=A0AAV0AAD9_PHORO|nr:pregnancy-specific glycoprotein 22 [Phodopus roborovskii]CAH7392795.1 unknown_gene_12259 [Phodopus roborovskii]